MQDGYPRGPGGIPGLAGGGGFVTMPIMSASLAVPATTHRATPDALAAATPAGRNRVVDAARAVAMLAVVAGHWLVAMPVRTESGGIGGVNALETHVLFQWLTWLFQVMPLVFVVGGFANAANLASARERGQRDQSWVAARVRRLLKPTIAFALVWAGLRVAFPNAGLVANAARVAAIPLWFLATYVLVVAIHPVVDRFWQRSRMLTFAGLIGLSVLGDISHLLHGPKLFTALNHVWVFATCQLLGVLWFEGRLPAGRRAAGLAVGGFATAVGLVFFGPWPLSLVHVAGQEMSNAHPPTIVLLALGVAQVGLVRAIERRATAVLQRPKVWLAVAFVNLRMMSIYLWHFTALAIGAAIAIPLGIRPAAGLGSTSWWLTRPLWLGFLASILVGLVVIFGRFERGGTAHAHPLALVGLVPAVSLALVHVTAKGATAPVAIGLLVADVALAQTALRLRTAKR